MCPKSKRTLIIPKRKVSSRNFFNHIYACHATNRTHAMSTLKTFWGATATPFFRAVTKKFWNSIKLLIRKDRVHFLMYFRVGLLQGKLAKCNFVLSGCIRWWVAGGFCQGLFQSSLPSFSRKPFFKSLFYTQFLSLLFWGTLWIHQNFLWKTTPVALKLMKETTFLVTTIT